MKKLLLVTLALLFSANALARDNFKICWSIYVGWMPWAYGAEQGIVKKWADKYGIEIEVVQINDYIESINQYTVGQFDACTMTNMDALTIPAAGGVDSTALIVGDFSNGNDGVVLKGADQLAAIKGKTVNLVELSVSHYLLARALETVGLSERDISVVNTSDADLVAAYSTEDVTAVATWNPLLSEITAQPNSHKVFDSAQIPGEIIDLPDLPFEGPVGFLLEPSVYAKPSRANPVGAAQKFGNFMLGQRSYSPALSDFAIGWVGGESEDLLADVV